MLQFKTLRQP